MKAGNSDSITQVGGDFVWNWEEPLSEWLKCHYLGEMGGERNGTPLQCSCLENPRDGGACWPAVYGVAQSRTRLKQLSGSSSSPNLGLPLWLRGATRWR